MARYRKILVAIDGSESSKHALKESFKLASDEKCWVTVVSVIPSYEGDLGATWINNVKDAMEKPCKAALSEAEAVGKVVINLPPKEREYKAILAKFENGFCILNEEAIHE